MTADEFETYLRDLGLTVEVIRGQDGNPYTVVRDVEIPKGSLSGTQCDVGIGRWQATPYVVPPAIHTRPALVPMGQHSTQGSGLGSDWQYWSRHYDRPATPRNVGTHVLTVLGEV